MTFRPLKIFFVGISLFGLSVACQAATDDANIELTTNNGTTQFGVQNNAAADLFMVNSLGGVQISSNAILTGTTFYQNGSAVIGGAAQAVTFSSNVVMQGGVVNLGSANNPVNISSNVIMTGTTFYQNGSAVIGGAAQTVTFSSNVVIQGGLVNMGSANNPVTVSSNTILPGMTIYQNGTVVMGGVPTIPAPATAECTTGPSFIAGSNNYYGQIQCVTGAAGVAGIIATVTVVTAAAPRLWVCTVTPANTITASAFGTTGTYTTPGRGSWVLNSNLASAGAKTYLWNYTCGAY